eukprot:COSAG01_NODE_370_length_18018_cov_142.063620_16_plen_64_part_00
MSQRFDESSMAKHAAPPLIIVSVNPTACSELVNTSTVVPSGALCSINMITVVLDLSTGALCQN